MSGTLTLASALASLDRAGLERVVRARSPQSVGTINDPIGLATALLKPDSITQAISSLDAAAISALLRLADPDTAAKAPATTGSVAATADPALTVPCARGLVGLAESSPIALPEVSSALMGALKDAGVEAADLLTTVPGAVVADPQSSTSDVAGAVPPESAEQRPSDSWYVAAVTAVAQAAECLRALQEHPCKLNRNGTVAVTAVRALAETTRLTPEEVSLSLEALTGAALAHRVPAAHKGSAAMLVATAAGAAWLREEPPERWLALAIAELGALPAELNELPALTEAGDLAAAAAAVPAWFPLSPPQLRERIASCVAAADHLGLTVHGQLSAPGRMLYDGDTQAATELVAREMPEPAPGVYVQPDLSVVVPGPLSAANEAALSAITVPDHIGIASTRRFTETAIVEAVERGITPAELRAVLDRLSLTGVPQPLQYLLDTIAKRVGGIVVHDHHGDEGRTRIAISRPDLVSAMLVDRALQHLQLHRPVPDQPVLFSRLRPEHVTAALADARYHASRAQDQRPAPSAHIEAGAPLTPRTASVSQSALATQGQTGRDEAGTGRTAQHDGSRSANQSGQADQTDDPITALVERVHQASHQVNGTGDFTRRLELAIRDRSALLVTAESRGESRTFTLVPMSVNAGRLRATDQIAGVERTFPISMITALATP